MKINLSSLAVRIPLFAIFVVVTISGLITYISYSSARGALEQAASERLAGVANTRAQMLTDWAQTQVTELEGLRDSPSVRAAILRFASGWNTLGGDRMAYLQRYYIDRNANRPGEKDKLDDAGDGSAWSGVHARVHKGLRELKDLWGYHDIFLIDPRGDVVYSVLKERDFATNVESGPYFKTGLGKAFRAAMAKPDGAPVFEDFASYEPSDGEPAAFLAAAVPAPGGGIAGVVAVQLPVDRLNAVADNRVGLGKTGHVILVGGDGLRRNTDGGTNILEPVDGGNEVALALQGKSGVETDTTSLGGTARVISAFTPLGIFNGTWALIAEENRSELMASAIDLRDRGLLVMALASLAAILVGVFLARLVVGPLTTVAGAMDRIAARDYDFDVPYQRRGDETGMIARNLESFRAKLKAGEAAERMALFKARAFSSAPAAFMLVDRDLNIVEYNDALRQVFRDNLDALRENWPDFDPDALVGANIDRFHKSPAHQRAIMADPANLPHVADIVLGETRLQLTIEAICDDAGAYVGAMLEWKDVAEARVNSAIMEALRRNQTMLEYDCEFRVQKYNDKFAEIFGWGPEVVGKTFEALFGPNEDTRIGMERLRKGLTVTRKVERPTKSGQKVFVEVVMNPVFSRQGVLDRIVEIGSDVTRLEVARREAEAESQARSDMQRRVVEELSRGLSALAEGDLTVALEAPFAEEYDAVRQDFNAAREKLEALVAQLLSASGQINSGASRIAKASDDLSRRTESQAATLEETSAALHKMTGSLKTTAASASDADKAVRAARTDAEDSGKVMAEAVQAMGEIQSSSSQIVKIIGVIDNIAFQTNLLALNAGVGAARAGEAGRGFAVVASEVRDLAQRSSEAAKEIENLISASSGHVNQGVDLVGKAGDTLQSVLGAVANLSTLVSGIASAQEEQSTGLSEISAGANALAEVTQRNAAMVDQSTNESHALREQAERLSALVAKFRLAEAREARVVNFEGAQSATRKPAQRRA